MWDAVKQSNIYITSIQKERRENRSEAVSESVKDENFSNVLRHQPTDSRRSVNTKKDKHTHTKPYIPVLQTGD